MVTSGEVVVVVERRDVEPVGAVGHLGPPAIKNRAIQYAIERGLLAAGATGLERAARRVQPHVAAVVHRAGDADVVVGDEDEAVAHIGVSGELGDLLDQALAGMVGRVSLSGEDELHGSINVEQKCT